MKKLISFMLSTALCLNTASFVYATKPEENARRTAFYNRKIVSSPLETLKSVDGAKSDELELSRPTDEELLKLAEVYKSVEIGYFLRNNDKSLTEEEALADLNKYNSGQSVSFVVKNSAGDMVGELMLTLLGNNIVNIAYWILPQFRGHNYAAKACELLIKESLAKNPSLVFLIGFDGENKASKSVAEKLEKLLTSRSETEDASSEKKLNYKVIKLEPFKIKYQISSLDDNSSKFELGTFVNNEKVSSQICTAEQIKNITYKRIFDLKEVEITKFNYYITRSF